MRLRRARLNPSVATSDVSIGSMIDKDRRIQTFQQFQAVGYPLMAGVVRNDAGDGLTEAEKKKKP